MDIIKISVTAWSKPEWCCVTNTDKLGYGVYSWHHKKEDADHNAEVLKGKAVPVDYYKGEMITPAYAMSVAIKRA